MKLEVADPKAPYNAGFTQVVISTEDSSEVLSFITRNAYSRVKIKNPLSIFDELNAYLKWRGPDVCAATWRCYSNMYETLNSGTDPYMILNNLVVHTRAMMKHHPMDHMREWLMVHGGLYIPSEIPDSIDPNGRYSNNDGRTYYKSDYINLATLCLATRLMIPIWGAYIETTTVPGARDDTKSVNALAMLNDTEFMNWPLDDKEQSAFNKLLNYIDAATEQHKDQWSSLWKGISDSEKPMWYMSRVITRRLTIAPLTDPSVTHPIINNIHQYVKTMADPQDTPNRDRIDKKIKDVDQNRQTEEDKTGVLEHYKLRHWAVMGDLVAYRIEAEDPITVALRVDPTVPQDKLQACMEAAYGNNHNLINEHQRLMMQWVLAKVFPPRAVLHIKPEPSEINARPLLPNLGLIAVAQALLWHWGFVDLAMFMQVERISISEQNTPNIPQNGKVTSRKSSRYDDELMIAYPHVKPQRVGQNGLIGKPVDGSLVSEAINNLTKLILGGNWLYNGPKALQRESGGNPADQFVATPPNIKNRIAELTLHLASINQ